MKSERGSFFALSSRSELYPFRHGLQFAFFNTLSWQVGIGTPMILLAERLGANSFQVGLIYSFVFLMTPLQLFSTVLLPRFGYKRVMLSGWGIRSFFLLIPGALALMAPEETSPWMVHILVWSVFFFCFFRAIGASAIIPWLYGIVPAEIRGRYFASDQFVSGSAGVGTLLTCSILFAVLPDYPAFASAYAIALAGSFLSFFALAKLPDAERPDPISLGKVIRDTPTHCLRPSRYRYFLWISIFFMAVSSPIPPFSAYYLKVSAQLPPSWIVMFSTLQYAGVIAGALIMRSRIDRSGAKPFFVYALFLYLLVAGYWWYFLAGGSAGIGLLPLIYPVLGLAASFWFSANLNYLPQIIPVGERPIMVSLHGALTALVGGLSPLAWGLFLKGKEGVPSIDTGAFQVYFAVFFVSGFILLALVAPIREEAKTGMPPLVVGKVSLRPFRALTYLVNLAELNPERRASRKPGDQPPDEKRR